MFINSRLLRVIPTISTTKSFSAFKPRSAGGGHLKTFFAGRLEQDHWIAGDQPTGRPWDVNLLRTKSWDDLHILWSVLLREKNLLYTRLRDQENSPNPKKNPLGYNLTKVKVSMKNIKYTVHERYSAWSKAQKLWELKQRGFDIYDSDTIQLIKNVEKDEKIIRLMKKKGRFMKGYSRYLFSQLNFKWPPISEKKNPADSFKIVPGEGKERKGYDIDMTPVSDRRYKTRRTLSRMREGARSEV